MNRRQKISLWVGITVFVLMGLFPPWYRTTRVRAGVRTTTTYYDNYSLLWHPPRGGKLDTHRLYVQWIIVAVVTGGLMLTFHGSKATKPPSELASSEAD